MLSLLWLAGALTLLAACSAGDATFARYLEADARPSDPTIRVQFGRGRLPSDFPAGLPVPDHATVLGWQRTTSDMARSWQVVYEAPGDLDRLVSALLERLSKGSWQVTDRATRGGYQSLNIAGDGSNSKRTGVIAAGPATRGGRVQIIEEIGEDR